MPKFTFTLPKKITKEGVQQVGGKYNFENGKLTVEEDVARKIKKVLTTYYGCTISQAQATEEEVEAQKAEANDDDAVLSKTATKGSTKAQ